MLRFARLGALALFVAALLTGTQAARAETAQSKFTIKLTLSSGTSIGAKRIPQVRYTTKDLIAELRGDSRGKAEIVLRREVPTLAEDLDPGAVEHLISGQLLLLVGGEPASNDLLVPVATDLSGVDGFASNEQFDEQFQIPIFRERQAFRAFAFASGVPDSPLQAMVGLHRTSAKLDTREAKLLYQSQSIDVLGGFVFAAEEIPGDPLELSGVLSGSLSTGPEKILRE